MVAHWWALRSLALFEAVHSYSGNFVHTVTVMDVAATGVVYSWSLSSCLN